MNFPESRLAPGRAVLCDLDGVLIDSSAAHAGAYARVFERHRLAGVAYPQIAGRPTREVFAELGLTGARLDEIVREKQLEARRALRSETRLCPGALELLAQLREAGLRVALVTGASRESVRVISERFGLAAYFDAVVAAEDTAAGKPAPEPFLAACEKLDVLPEEALVVEDSASGLRAARAAGIPACLVGSAEPSRDVPDASAADLRELAALLRASSSGEESPVRFRDHIPLRPRRSGCVAVIPAAGLGSRLGHPGAKLLYEVNGESILCHLERQLAPVVDSIVLVVSPQGEGPIGEQARRLSTPTQLAIQPQPLGMADAVLASRSAPAAAGAELRLIVWGDQVTVQAGTLQRLITLLEESGADLALPTRTRGSPYIHFQRDRSGRPVRVLQARENDAMPAFGETDCGAFLVRSAGFYRDLARYMASPAERGAVTGEVNFLPFLVAPQAGFRRIATLRGVDPRETLGVNTPEEAALAGRYLRELQAAGAGRQLGG
jgi:HAD superfamily hydrolase (TIGR01509 family)